MASNLGQGLAQQQAQNYNIGNSLGLNALQTIQGLRMQPYNTLQNNVMQAFQANQGAGMDLLNSGQNFLGNQQNYDMNQLNQLSSLVRALLGPQQQEQQLQYGAQASRGNALGQGLGAIIPAIAGIARRRGPTVDTRTSN